MTMDGPMVINFNELIYYPLSKWQSNMAMQTPYVIINDCPIQTSI